VPIHEIGEQDGVPYFVMPLIHGIGLDRLLEDPGGRIPTEPAERACWVASLGARAALALAYSHSQDVLRRDIKPSNLLLDDDGAVWLVDFGLAKLADELSLTSTGDLPGTLRYLAPECLHAAGDARSDIYSLGLTLYELLVGRPAFPAMDRARLLHQIQAGPVAGPRRLAPGLPRDIETVVLQAMAFDPSARYSSAADLAADLGRFLEGRPIRARRASPVEHLVRWCRRNPAVAGLAATSLVLGLVAAIFVGLFLMAPPHHRGRPPEPAEFPPAKSPLRAEAPPPRVEPAKAASAISFSKPKWPPDHYKRPPRWDGNGRGPFEYARKAPPNFRGPMPGKSREGHRRGPPGF
jgi:serine/threonine protein kinase